MNKSTITREPITHYLKIYPEFFSAVCTGVKRAELRKNDRDYRVGDTLHLMETPRGSCHQTGEFINVKITHITDVDEWMPGYVLLSIEREALDSESVILYRERNPYNGLTTGWQELTENELSFLKENAGENAEFLKLYRHAQPTVSKPWGYTSGILNPAVGMACVTPTRGKNQFPVYIDLQPAPVVMDDEKLRALFDAWFASDCSFDQSPEASEADNIAWRESYWYVWQRCRAAMFQAGNSPAIPGAWIPVSERLPEFGDYLVTDGCDFDVQLFNGEEFIPGFIWEDKITHWMPLPSAPQEVKGE